jgi:NADH dehydrogenase [ubiquinone] 1 alpha subcomplex assembly factor 8
MESVRKAKDRLAKYPVLVAKCSTSAAAYAACVTRDLDIQKHACDKEFQQFKRCLVDQAKTMKTRL